MLYESIDIIPIKNTAFLSHRHVVQYCLVKRCDFSKQKIVWGEISDRTKFALDENAEFITEATTFLMTGESLKFLLCFLNSKLSEYYFSKIGTTTGVGTVRWKKYKIETFPIPKLTSDEEIPFIEIVDQIIDRKKNALDTAALEQGLDKRIYGIFGFSDVERQTIER